MRKLLTALVTIIALFCQLSLQAEAQCSKTKLCEDGCCSSAGYCGYGPDFCGKGCLSTCNRKSECNPGWKSSDFSKHDKCPLNVCCSKHGFCGFTEDFCGKTDKVKRPSCSPGDKPVNRVIGYYESWSTKERSCMSMTPEDIPYGMYTHIIFSFATINPKTFTVSTGDKHTENMMTRIGALKLTQPDLKIWIAFGGWAFNDKGPTQSTFSDLAASAENTHTFLESLGKMINKYGFDGVDIDWEYPVDKDRHGKPADYKNAVKFMKKLRAKMNSMRKGVSMALPASYWYLQNFDLKQLASTVDWFNLMTYDVHGSWDIDNEWTGPWVNSHTNLTEIQQGLDLLWRNDISPKKVTMGMSFYSRTFTLTDPKCNTPGCEISSGGDAGSCSDTAGVLLHAELQEIIKEKKLKPTLDRKAAVKTVSWGNQWTAYDDLVTWRLKANLARSQCIDGFMVWALSQDDSSSTNAKALNKALGRKVPEFPGFKEKKEKPKKQENHLPGICHWTSCFEECPSGFKSVQRDGHKEIMLDTTHCVDNLEGKGFSRLCCPSDQELPVCRWRGHHDRKCTPGCNKGEVEVGTTKAGCRKNHQSACCDLTDATAAYDKCYWSGCVEEGSNPCGGNFASHVASSKIGSGGIRRCSNTQTRAFCCSNPAPFPFNNRCEWVRKAGFLEVDSLWNFCEGACHKGQVRVALESGLHYGNANDGKGGCDGEVAYCCDFESKLDKREEEEDEDEDGVEGASEFSMLLDKYLDNPTCPATTLHPSLHHDSKYIDSFRKRDLIAESIRFEVLAGRATDCYEDNWHRLLGYAVLIFKSQESGIKPMWKIWDAKFARRFGQAVTAYSIVQFLKDFPGYDPYGIIERILYFPNDAASDLNGARRAATTLCRVPPTTHDGPSRRSEFGKRIVHMWAENDPNANIPPLINILEGILDGHLTLHYARWQYMRGASIQANAGPFLELAYWIGQDPGNAAEVVDRSEFEDGSYRMEDRWVVFHFHIGHPVPARNDPTIDQPPIDWISQINGHSYMGVEAMSVYHGQQVRAAASRYAWRVDSQDPSLNARDTYTCSPVRRWYVGSVATPGTWDMEDPDDQVMEALERFGVRLWEQGYVRGPGLRLILEGGDYNYREGREINPRDPGRVLGVQEPNRVVGGNPANPPPGGMPTWGDDEQINGYTVNWLLDDEDYNFAPPGPPDL